MKHFKQLTIVIMCISLLLCGCGGTTDSNNIKNKDAFTLSEYISSGETIWFLTDGTGKDSEIETIYVLEADGTMYYCSSNWTLGEAEQKEDSDISSIVKKKYEENMLKKISDCINGPESFNLYANAIGNTVLHLSDCETSVAYSFGDAGVTKDNQKLYEIATECYQACIPSKTDDKWAYFHLVEETSKVYAQKYIDWQSSYLTTAFEPYASNIKPAQYKLSLISDSTGNNTQNELIVFQDFAPLKHHYAEGYFCNTTTLELSYVNAYESDKGAVNCANVYDSWYGGYRLDDDYLITRVNEPKLFQLDTIGTENISVDNTNSLFDKSVIIELPRGIGG